MRINIRVIAATKKLLPAMVAGGRFREDLFYRLNVVPLYIPPLRERLEDIPLLVNKFIEDFCDISDRKIETTCTIEDETMSYLMAYDYPGNIRELRTIIHSVLNLTQGCYISTAFLPKNVFETKKVSTSRQYSTSESLPPLELVEKNYILKVYFQMDKNKSKTAEVLGIDRNTLRKKIQSYGVE